MTNIEIFYIILISLILLNATNVVLLIYGRGITFNYIFKFLKRKNQFRIDADKLNNKEIKNIKKIANEDIVKQKNKRKK